MSEAVKISRRGALSAVVLASAATLTTTPAIALAGPPLAAGREEWDAAMRDYLSVKAAYDAFTPGYDAAYDAYQRGAPSLDVIDWTYPEFAMRNRRDVAENFDVEAHIHFVLGGEGTWWSAACPADKIAQVRAACDSLLKYRAAKADHETRVDILALNRLCDETGEAEVVAGLALIALPAPDLAAVVWKVAYLFPEDEESTPCYDMEKLRQFRADIRHFAALAAQNA